MQGALRCGTSGWLHADWNSVVYPQAKPRGFHPLEHLSQYLDLVEIDTSFQRPLAAEMRHASWTLDEALGTLMDYRVGFCNVDQPSGVRAMPPDAIITSPIGYVRLLGRNGGDWTEEETAADYLYTPQELGCWQTRIERLRAHTNTTFVVTANHTAGKAVVNALQMKTMLRATTSLLRQRVPPIPLGRE